MRLVVMRGLLLFRFSRFVMTIFLLLNELCGVNIHLNVRVVLISAGVTFDFGCGSSSWSKKATFLEI